MKLILCITQGRTRLVNSAFGTLHYSSINIWKIYVYRNYSNTAVIHENKSKYLSLWTITHSEFEKVEKWMYWTSSLSVIWSFWMCIAMHNILSNCFFLLFTVLSCSWEQFGSCVKQTIKCIKTLKMMQCEIAELGEQYTFTPKKLKN